MKNVKGTIRLVNKHRCSENTLNLIMRLSKDKQRLFNLEKEQSRKNKIFRTLLKIK